MTQVTAAAAEPLHDAGMHPHLLAWAGLRYCRMKLRERAIRWRRQQAQMRGA